MKKKWYKNWKIMVPVVLVSMIIIGSVLPEQTYTATKTYTVPEVKAQEAVEGKEAIWQDTESYGSRTKLDDGKYIVGEDLESGIYDVSFQRYDGADVSGNFEVYRSGEIYYNYFMFDNGNKCGTTKVLDGIVYDTFCESVQNISLKDGDIIKIVNADSSHIVFDEVIYGKKLVSPAVSAVPAVEAQEAYNITETIEITNDVETCTANDTEVDCNELKYYVELKDEAMNE